MSEPTVKLASAGSIYVHAMIFAKAGDANQGHAHTYDHFTLIARGKVRVESNGREVDVPELEIVFIPKNVVHRITALEDNTVVCCLHALHSRDDPGEILDGTVIPPGTPPWALVTSAVPLLAADAKAQGIQVP
jgi:quercetin dioxygenase-like cupin family protein